MKKLFKKILLCSVCLFSLISTTGCFSSPMKIKYTVTTSENGGDLVSNLSVYGTIEKKFRESAETPCYLKIKRGYSKIKTTEANQECFENGKECYIKEGKKYVKLVERSSIEACANDDVKCYIKKDGKYVVTKDNDVLKACAIDQATCYVRNAGSYIKMKVKNAIEIQKCVIGEKTCYQYVEFTTYKQTKDEEIHKCYTKYGDVFEIETYNRDEKYEIEKIKVIETRNDITKYVNEKVTKIPSEEEYGLVYRFDIKNNEAKTIYIEALEFGEITNNLVKKKSAHKFKINTTAEKKLIDNKVYYVVEANKQISIEIEIKNLKTSDMYNKKNKELNLNINLALK